jgi:predicted AAA+ superfamily ATPase
MIPGNRHLNDVQQLLRRSPVVALLGARQVGKTTLARELLKHQSGPTTRFDLEDPDDLARLAEPKLALGTLAGIVVIDEVQRRPDLFPVLRVLVDRPESKARFLILGSASPHLLRQGSETLAGRIAFHELDGLAPTDDESAAWRREFVRTFLERDLPQLGSQVPSATLQRFWSMLAHHHAQVWNAAELARALGVSGATVRSYGKGSSFRKSYAR